MMMWKSLLWLAGLAIVINPVLTTNRPIVKTREGEVQGISRQSFEQQDYISFKGIPYAAPPVGELRFQRTHRHSNWPGVRSALHHGSKCLHADYMMNGIIVGEEDCLFINVYTPQLPRDETAETGDALPVMVFVHGGGFATGSGDADFYGPDYLMDYGVVLVTFNYRLGAFGFATTEDAAAPGNYGLHDQVLALRWVQDNIAVFGGDPRQVTVFGESAGAASVSLLALSPHAQGLFSRAITQSGASFCKYAASGARQDGAKQLADKLNCPTASSEQLIDCLKHKSGRDIVLAEKTLSQKSLSPIFVLHRPRIDTEAETPMLPDDPHALLKSGNFSKVPWLSGMNKDEGWFFVSGVLSRPGGVEALLGQVWSQWSDSLLELNNVSVDPETIAQTIYRHYYNNDDAVSPDNMAPLIRMMSDRWCSVCVGVELELMAEHTSVYRYLLDLTGPGRQNLLEALSRMMGQLDKYVDMGVPHAEDLLYLFKPIIVPPILRDSDQHRMIRFMASLWTNFARDGRPSSSQLPLPEWPEFTVHDQRHMSLNLNPSLDHNHFLERTQFWKQLEIAESWRAPLVVSKQSLDAQRDEL